MTNPSPDPYLVLGMGHNATADDLKAAYRRLARQYHPDLNPAPAASAQFDAVNRAYRLLSDEAARAAFDRGMLNEVAARQLHTSFGPEQAAALAHPRSGRPRPLPLPQQAVGDDVQITVYPTGVQREGGTVVVQRERYEPCPRCQGAGAAAVQACPGCAVGSSPQPPRSPLFGWQVATCPTCEGSRTVTEQPCAQCWGQGRRLLPFKLSFRSSSGFEGGQRRVQGAGDAGVRGGKRGDLVVTVAPPSAWRLGEEEE